MNNFNKKFHTADGIIFTKISAAEAANFTGNYITVIDNQAVAVVEGQEVPVPGKLYNEIGVEYLFVDFYQHARRMAKKHGVYFAVKQENIRVWKNVRPGETLRTIIDGYEEHAVTLDENSVAAQNVVKNEYYAVPKKVLAEKYVYDHSEFDYDVYVPRSDKPSEWVYSDVNVFGILWGGLEFLTTPMINITNQDDCYGCNYVVWWGNDGRLASYRVIGYFSTGESRYYDEPLRPIVRPEEPRFQPPKEMYI